MQLITLIASTIIAAISANAKDASGYRTGPVKKVVNLLKDLKSKIAQDGKTEQQIYDKYACWCEKASSAKATAIEKAQDDLRALGQDILKYKGKTAVLAAEMTQLQTEIKANKEEQAEATALRQKENEAYSIETAEMKEALAALQQAIIVLRKATTLIQVGDSSAASEATAQGRKAVEAFVKALPVRVHFKNSSQAALLSEFVASKDQAKYSPQSFSVQGILTDMYETFSSDLESSTQAEATANTNFEALIHTKTKELLNLETILGKKTAAKAEAEESLAETTMSYDDTETQMKADVKFFDEAKASCSAKAAEWKTRSDMRAEELEGITKALELLTSDEARVLFKSAIKEGVETGPKKVYNARSAEDQIQHDTSIYETGKIYGSGVALLQVGNTRDVSEPLAQAYGALKGSARRVHSVRLAMLAAQVGQAKVGHFDKVLAAIDTMIQTLKDEDAADISKRDQCIDEYKNIDSTVANVTWLIKNNVAKIDKLQSKIEKREAEREQTIVDIATVNQTMQDMTAERSAENNDFKAAKKEDEDAIMLLVEARKVLSSYYSNNSVEMGPIQGEVKGLALNSLHQGPEFEVAEFDAPDAEFSDKGKRKNEAKGIVQLLTTVIEDLTDEITNGMKNEALSQLEYEKLFKAAEELKTSLETKKVNLEDTIATRKEDKSNEEQIKLENEADLKDELDYKADIKTDCDWMLKAFKEREGKRQAELEGLIKAKEFLAGLNKEALLETSGKHPAKKTFDDTKLVNIRFLGVRP